MQRQRFLRILEPRIDHVYSAEQYSQGYPPGIEHHYWNRARNLVLARMLRRAGVTAQDQILEIGCGTGVVVDHLVQEGFHCEGIDAGPVPHHPRVAARLRSPLEFENLPASERESYSVVLLLDVIEHWKDPVAHLRDVHRLFSNLRLLVIFVPARSEIWSAHDEHFGHFRRYGLDDLTAHLSEAKFSVTHRGYFFRPLYWAARALLMLGKDRGTSIRAPRGAVRWVHQMVAQALDMDARILPGAWRGSSAFALARATSEAEGINTP